MTKFIIKLFFFFYLSYIPLPNNEKVYRIWCPVQDLAFTVNHFVQNCCSCINYYLVSYHVFNWKRFRVPAMTLRLWLMINILMIVSWRNQLWTDHLLKPVMTMMLQLMNIVRKLRSLPPIFLISFSFCVLMDPNFCIYIQQHLPWILSLNSKLWLTSAPRLGLIRRPKHDLLKELRRAIKLCEHALVPSDPTVTSLGTYQQVGFLCPDYSNYLLVG